MADSTAAEVIPAVSTRRHSPVMGKETIDTEASSDSVEAAVDYAPDGGLAAWLVVFGAWCTSFCSYGWINSIGIFQDYYEHNMLKDYSTSAIAWIPSLQIFFVMGLGVIVGKLFDRHGPRYLILGGTILHVFGLMMASLSTEYYQILLSQGICSSLGASALFQPAISSVRQWFDKNRALAFGIASTGSSTGGIIFPIMLSRLVKQVGFAWAMRISAFLILALLILANLTVRTRIPQGSQNRANHKVNHLSPFRELASVLVLLGFFLITFGVFIPIDYVVVEANASGMGHNIVQYLVPILNAASIFGRISSGLMGDKFGRFNMFAVVCGVTGILTLALWIPANNNAATISFAALFGSFSGAYISLGPATVAEISPPEEFGYRTGLLFAIASVAGLITNPIAGAIVQREHGSFTGLKVFAGAFCLVGTIVSFGARISKTGFKVFIKF